MAFGFEQPYVFGGGAFAFEAAGDGGAGKEMEVVVLGVALDEFGVGDGEGRTGHDGLVVVEGGE